MSNIVLNFILISSYSKLQHLVLVSDSLHVYCGEQYTWSYVNKLHSNFMIKAFLNYHAHRQVVSQTERDTQIFYSIHIVAM